MKKNSKILRQAEILNMFALSPWEPSVTYYSGYSVAEVSEKFNVKKLTIHRDMAELRSRGIMVKVKEKQLTVTGTFTFQQLLDALQLPKDLILTVLRFYHKFERRGTDGQA